jgi:hypothetical protein
MENMEEYSNNNYFVSFINHGEHGEHREILQKLLFCELH